MQTPHFESSLYVLLKVSGHFWVDLLYMFELNGCFFGYICIYKTILFPWRLILEMLDCHEFCYDWSKAYPDVPDHETICCFSGYLSKDIWCWFIILKYFRHAQLTKPNWLFLCMYIHIQKLTFNLKLN